MFLSQENRYPFLIKQKLTKMYILHELLLNEFISLCYRATSGIRSKNKIYEKTILIRWWGEGRAKFMAYIPISCPGPTHNEEDNRSPSANKSYSHHFIWYEGPCMWSKYLMMLIHKVFHEWASPKSLYISQQEGLGLKPQTMKYSLYKFFVVLIWRCVYS